MDYNPTRLVRSLNLVLSVAYESTESLAMEYTIEKKSKKGTFLFCFSGRFYDLFIIRRLYGIRKYTTY
jgi:hypothetical protein